MKNQFIVLLFAVFIGLCDANAQVKQLNDAPLYEFGGQSSKGLAYFADENIQDSLKVFFKVEVSFKHILQENSSPKVSSVQVLDINAINLQKPGNPQEFYLTLNDIKRHEKYQCIWERYAPYITTWYEKLPYDIMKIPEYYGLKKITFIGVLMMIPQNCHPLPESN